MGHESRYFEASDKAKAFVKDNIMIDSLTALINSSMIYPEMFEEYNERAIETGIDGMGYTAAHDPLLFDGFIKESQTQLSRIYASDGRYVVARSGDDIRRAHKNGSLAIYFNAQGACLLNNDPNYYAPLVKNAGVGTIALAYNERHRAGDGCLVQDAGKVSMYGTQVIDALHRNNILLDLSHASEETALSAMEYSRKEYGDKPVIYTHSTPRAVCDIYRSISDEAAQACADSGGVVSIVTLPFFIADISTQETTPEHIVDAIDYTKDLIGIDHIGISSDDVYSWPRQWEWALKRPEMYQDGGLTVATAKHAPSGSAEAAKIYPAVVDLMWARGYSDEDIAKVMGGNLLRVYDQAW